jgi:phosphate transport system protein
LSPTNIPRGTGPAGPSSKDNAMGEHIVRSFDEDLDNLRRSISEMGGIAEKLTVDSIAALVRRDAALAQAVIAADKRLDALQRQIEENAVLVIARRQPIAIDLRETVSVIRVANDLERIGDLSKNVAKRVVAISDEVQPQKIVLGVQHMSDLVQEQLKDVLDAYASRDVSAARDVWDRDGAVDALYNSLFRELLTYMMEDPRNISFCTHLLFCAKNIERIGDHTTNIAETIHYLVTGGPLDGERPKDDASNYATVSQAASA